MFERFKRSHTDDDAETRRSGAVATAERPEGSAAGDPAATDDRGIRRDSAAGDHSAYADDRTATHDRATDDRTATHDRATDDRTATHDRATDDRTATHDRATDDRTATHDRAPDDRSATDDRAATRERTTRTGNGAATSSALATARARQREEYGGVNWGASFFGWLVAVGVAALLTALLAAAGAAIGLTATTESDVASNAEELSLGGGIALLVVLMLAYYAGGYVAGRMSRFDGARQGLGTWLIGLIVTIGLAIAAVILGDEYNVLERLNLPSLPVGDQTFATGGIVALAAIVLGTLLAALFGGKVGERYHKRVDRAGFVD